MRDDFSLLFSSPRKRKKKMTESQQLEMDSETKPEPMLQMPQNEEVQAIDLRRAVENAEEQLNKTKGTFAEKIGRLKRRALVVQREQEKLRKNLVKYNNFVREKQAKVEEGDRVWQEEKSYQDLIQQLIKDKRETVESLEKAKVLLENASKKREIFRDFMQNVVVAEGNQRNRYKDIGELMKRCETLVVTRDESMAALQRHQDEIQDQEVQLAAFKEAKHERILNLSSRQNSLQEVLYHIQAKRESRQRLIDQEDQEQISKELSVANIRLSILTLWQYANSKKVVLPSDPKRPKGAKDRPPTDTAKQLDAVQAHIEDLEVVIAQVQRSEDAQGYMSPLVSEFSELRLDY